MNIALVEVFFLIICEYLKKLIAHMQVKDFIDIAIYITNSYP
jgi:hypothetical protein